MSPIFLTPFLAHRGFIASPDMAFGSEVRGAVVATAACAALGLCATSFVPSAAPAQAQPAVRQLRSLRGVAAAEDKAAFGNGASLVAAGSAALILGRAAAVAKRQQRSKAVRRAEAAVETKKKGVRVVEGKEIPWNIFSPKSPYKGTTISNETITTPTRLPNWQTCHVVMRHDGECPYLEGQSIGIIAPGPDKKGEVPAKIRLYSIASSSVGDDETSKTVSLCVKRVLEVDGMGWCKYSNVVPGTDKEYPDSKMVYRGVCSTHICELKPGDEVLITGPVGAEMLLPEDPEANVLMMATGTGIAPFRSHLRHLLHDKVAEGRFKGLAWLFLGVPFSNSILYDAEWKAMQAQHPDQFRYDYAVSNEEKCEKNKINGEMWVQHKMMEHSEALWALVKNPKTHIYMCGLKGMESGFAECFQPMAEAEGLVWEQFAKSLKSAGRYHVEVY